eukprot:1159858-Pelagomonas_calceolata.AAC.15
MHPCCKLSLNSARLEQNAFARSTMCHGIEGKCARHNQVVHAVPKNYAGLHAFHCLPQGCHSCQLFATSNNAGCKFWDRNSLVISLQGDARIDPSATDDTRKRLTLKANNPLRDFLQPTLGYDASVLLPECKHSAHVLEHSIQGAQMRGRVKISCLAAYLMQILKPLPRGVLWLTQALHINANSVPGRTGFANFSASLAMLPSLVTMQIPLTCSVKWTRTATSLILFLNELLLVYEQASSQAFTGKIGASGPAFEMQQDNNPLLFKPWDATWPMTRSLHLYRVKPHLYRPLLPRGFQPYDCKWHIKYAPCFNLLNIIILQSLSILVSSCGDNCTAPTAKLSGPTSHCLDKPPNKYWAGHSAQNGPSTRWKVVLLEKKKENCWQIHVPSQPSVKEPCNAGDTYQTIYIDSSESIAPSGRALSSRTWGTSAAVVDGMQCTAASDALQAAVDRANTSGIGSTG